MQIAIVLLMQAVKKRLFRQLLEVLKLKGRGDMVLSTMRMTIPIEKQNDALKIIRSIALQSRDVSGCISYSIYRDLDDSNILMFQTKWANDNSLAVHIRSKEYRNLLLVLEMSIQQPEVVFDSISSSAGIETIEKIRNFSDN